MIKKLLLGNLFTACALLAFGQTYDVTFKVDMNKYTSSFTTVYVSGTFNSWSGNSNALTDANSDGVWEGTIAINQNSTIEYKFTLDDWNAQEIFAGGESCTVTNGGFTNRELEVKSDMTLDAVCFNACVECSKLQTVDITFELNTAQITVASTGIYLAGGSSFGSPGDNEMLDGDNDGVYTITVTRPKGFSGHYTFTNGSCADWSCKENISGLSCADANNFNDRLLPKVHSDTTIKACFGNCVSNGTCVDPNAKDQIDLPIDWEGTDTDYSVADFGGTESKLTTDPNDASNTVLQSDKGAGDALWAGTTLSTGKGFASDIPFDANNNLVSVDVYSPDANIPVRLKVELAGTPTVSVETEATTTTSGEWETLVFDFSKEVSGTAKIDYNNTYNLMSIFYNFGTDGNTAGDKTYYCDNIKFGSSTDKDVTFNVNLNDYAGSYTTVYVAGTFNGWCGDCNAMTDDDMDGIYTATITTDADDIEYKFLVDNWADSEQLTEGDPCTVTDAGFTNRYLALTGDVSLDPVCWASCSDCETGGDYDVTFQVDMNDYSGGTFTTVYLAGTFNAWCGECAPMSDDDMDGVYELTVDMTDNIGEIEYKFQVDNWTDDEKFAGGESCTKTTGEFTNRVHEVTGTETLPVVCWESCDACGSGAANVDITFQVDMSEYDDSYTNVNLNGTFNDWCGDCAVMTDDDSDNIFELTLTLPAEDTIEYKFTVDGWTDDEKFEGGEECTKTTGEFTNRAFVPTEDATLDAVCWESCNLCGVGFADIVNNLFKVSPNPSNGIINITSSLNEDASITVYDYQGRVVYQAFNTSINNEVLDLSNEAKGMYLIQVSSATGVAFEKIIVE